MSTNYEAYLLDQVRAAVIVTDAEGVVRYWNRYAETLYGYTREEALGHAVGALIAPGPGHEHMAEISAALERGEVWEGESRLHRRDGSPVDVQQTITPLMNAEGRMASKASISLEISERKRLQNELHDVATTLRLMVETSPLAIINMDADGNVTMWSGAAEEMFGWRADEVEGGPLPYIPAEEREGFERIRERHRAGETLRGVEVRRLRRDGSLIDVAIFSTSLFDDDGRFTGTVAYVADTTERRRTQRRLEQLQDVTAALSGAVTGEDVGRVLVEQGREAAGACGALVTAVADNGRPGEVLAATGTVAQLADACAALPLEAEPGSPHRASHVRWIDSANGVDGESRLPPGTSGDVAVVPLVAGERMLGAVAFRFPQRAPLDDETRGFLQALGDRSALALERAELYERERAARGNAERLATRLRHVQGVTDAALAHLALDDLLEELTDRVRDALDTDTATLLLLDDDARHLRIRAASGFTTEDMQAVRVSVGEGLAGRIVAVRRPVVIDDSTGLQFAIPRLRRAGIRSVAGVPLLAGGRAIGALHVGSQRPRNFGGEDVRLLELVADRVAIAIENARHYEHERSIAETLQRSLLPERLPDVAGLSLAARYEPGGAGLEVGGDWYDALELPDGNVALVIGDVVGHGIEAASAMGQLRNALRVHLLEGSGPAEALQGLDRLVHAAGSGDMTTLVCLLIDPCTRRLRYSCAGHPPPLIVEPSGAARFLEGGRSLPLGASPAAVFVEATDDLPPESTLLLYTDGLVERRGQPIDEGLARLAAVATHQTDGVHELVEHILDELLESGHDDDTALVAVKPASLTADRLTLSYPAAPAALHSLRRALGRFLHAAGAEQDEAFDVLVATGEAAANAIEHAYGPSDARFEVDAEMGADGVRIAVRDRGRWRSPTEPGSGSGLALMEALTDSCQVARDERGTVVTMRRKLRAVKTE